MRRLAFFLVFIAGAARGDDLRVDYVRESLTGTHTHYQQYIDGLRVIGGERIERADRSGNLSVADTLARRGFSHVESSVVTAHHGELVYLNLDGTARLAIREIVTRSLWERYADDYDASTGELLHEEPLFYRVIARVFDPNPVAKLNDPTLRDANDSSAAVPDAAYSFVEINNLAPTLRMTGPNVSIVDVDPPFTMRVDASSSLLFDRSQPQFEEVNAYFHIDRSQQYLQSIGYSGARRLVGYSIPVDPHAVSGSDNSFFTTGDVPGQGALFFGDGGTDDAEDSDIMLHEYGHAIHYSISPASFSGNSASQSRAMAEGFGDYWAFSSNYAQTVASGRDPFCIGDWDARCAGDDANQRCGYAAGSDCLRRVDGVKTMSDFLAVDVAGTEHQNGEIWSSALREIFLESAARYGAWQGRRLTDQIVLEGLFGAPANANYAGQAKKILEADAALNGGADQSVICRAMIERRILAAGDCAAPLRGELTLFQSHTLSIHVEDGRTIDEVRVRVQTDGQPGRVILMAPDGTQVVLTNSPPADATYGFDTVAAQALVAFRGHSAAGDWFLTVEGASLRSWSLIIGFVGDPTLTSRPLAAGGRKIVPAVAHVTGSAGTVFISDVRIYNKTDVPASIIAVFTPTGADGNSQFVAVRLSVDAHQLMVLNDIVSETLETTGTGSLELLGDVDRVMVNSLMFTPSNDGAYGATIPAVDAGDAGAEQIAPLQSTFESRANVGVAEVGGRGGVVRFTFFNSLGAELGSTDLPVPPFGHAQTRVPVLGGNLRAAVLVVSGSPRVIAYGSVVDNFTGDAMMVPARPFGTADERVAIPIVHGGSDWRTDVWRASADTVTTQRDVKGDGMLIDTQGAIVSARTYAPSAERGTYGQFVPGILPSPLNGSIAVQQVLGVEQSPRLHTIVGLVNFASQPSNVTVVAFDGAGREVGRKSVVVAPLSLQQMALTAIVPGTLRDGRLEVSSTVAAYATVIDNATQDPFFIRGQY